MSSNSNQVLIQPTPGYDGYLLPAGNNAFTSNWADKRSTAYVSVSVSFTDVSGSLSVPDGYLHLESSNAPENNKVTFGSAPLGTPTPLDTQMVATSLQTASTVAGISGSYINRWELTILSARWFRVVYVPNTNKSGLMVSVWYTSPFLSS